MKKLKIIGLIWLALIIWSCQVPVGPSESADDTTTFITRVENTYVNGALVIVNVIVQVPTIPTTIEIDDGNSISYSGTINSTGRWVLYEGENGYELSKF